MNKIYRYHLFNTMPIVLEDDHIKINEIVQIFDEVNDINLNTKLQTRHGTNISINSSGVISSIIPSATSSVSGGIIVGNNLTISSGVLSGLAPPNLAPYRLVTDSYTKLEVDTKDNNTSNYILELLEVIPYETLSVPLRNVLLPTSSPYIEAIIINDEYDYISFTNTDVLYSITFPENIQCDILIVGGGGGGGTSYNTNSGAPGGGGGAGGLIFLENQIVPYGTYTIQVGKGGENDDFADTTEPRRGRNGLNSIFSYHPIEAVGGGGGGSRGGNESGADGGSGGGRSYQNGGSGGQGIEGQGFNGSGIIGSGGNGDGGGGAGASGSFSSGGVGKFNEGNFNFKEKFNLPTDNSLGEFFNNEVYFAGGGSGGNNFTDGGKGGGASGGVEGTGLDGLNNTGGGGSGCRSVNSTSGIQKLGGDGGSGVVIIRYKKVQKPNVGYLNYTLDGWKVIDIVTVIDGLLARIEALEGV